MVLASHKNSLSKSSWNLNTGYTPGIYADGYIVFAFPFVCSFVCSSFFRHSGTFVEFMSKFLWWCISHKLMIRNHLYILTIGTL